jgi:Tol biopolymer transport system component/DNA-binding winged helix-turn-helix (wHTH) protein
MLQASLFLGMPENSQSAPAVIRFGPFDADLQTQELRKHGVRLRLPRQSFQILKMLLERPGSLITREELRQVLWPSDTFVDFDHSLNAAVNRLREAVGDSADEPRLVETLPRRGYRFIGPIVCEQQDTGEKLTDQPETRVTHRFLWKVVVAATGLAVATGALAYWFRPTVPPPKVLHYKKLTNDGLVKETSCQGSFDLVTDGPRVYFPEYKSALLQVSVMGGDAVSIPTPFDCLNVLDMSPHRDELLLLHWAQGMEGEQPLWLLSIPSGAPRRLGSLTGHAGTWSPDGRSIVYANGQNLYIAKSDGSESRKLLRLEQGTVVHIRWSPDGKVLRFTVESATPSSTNSCSLWEISADGTNLHPLLPGWSESYEYRGNWTPDGKYFIFSAYHQGTSGIWAIREKQNVFRKTNHQPVLLTSGPISFWFQVPSIDGKRLFVYGGQHRGELTRYDLKSRELVPYLSGISAEGLDFSKDGLWVTYVTIPEGTLWRCRLDGSQRMQLTFTPMMAGVPRWSRDGKQIAFMAAEPRRNWKIYTIPFDGGTPEPITQDERIEVDPTWSPDGNTMVFGEAADSNQLTHIYAVDLRTRRVSELPGSNGLYSPRWSPDGRFIVALSVRGDTKMMLFDLQVRKWTELANVHVNGYRWSRDSKYVYTLDTSRHVEMVTYRIRIADHRLESVADFIVPKAPMEGFFGSGFGLTPDGSPLFLQDISSQDIYALEVNLP